LWGISVWNDEAWEGVCVDPPRIRRAVSEFIEVCFNQMSDLKVEMVTRKSVDGVIGL
jgi:hypothetical protein